MNGYNKYKKSGKRAPGAGIIKFFVKAFFVLVLCLLSYMWMQRKSIVASVIQRQLYKMDICDLDFTVADISLFKFELRDISWGEPDAPFLYLSSLKLRYSPRGLYTGGLDQISLDRFETTLLFDDENKLQSELIERVILAVERIKLEYPQSAGTKKKLVTLPAFELNRGRVNIAGAGGYPADGKVDFNASFGPGFDGVELRGELALLGDKNTTFQGRIELLSLEDDLSSLSAKIRASLDLRSLVDPALTFEPNPLEFTGEFLVRGIDNSPEWELKLQLPSVLCQAQKEGFSFSGELQGESEFSGSATNVSGYGEVYLSDCNFDLTGTPACPAISNWAERIYFDFELPDTRVEQLGDAQLRGRVGICNLSSWADNLIDIYKGCFDISFCASATNGLSFKEPSLGWLSCRVGDVPLQPGAFQMDLTNKIFNVQMSILVADEPLKVMLDLVVPVNDPQSGTLRVEVPAVQIDSSGRFGELARDKSKEPFNFSGVVSALINVEGLHSGATVSGVAQIAEGAYSTDKFELAGISMNLPFEFDKAFRSTGDPVMRIETMEAGNIQMAAGEVLFHLNSRELFVESARMGWAKGFLQAYSIHAGFDGNIRNEFVVYAEKVDLGEVFMLIMPFDGEMEGVLYGRFAVGLKKKRVELSSGYLYSLPGQGGMLKLNDPAQMTTLLGRAGIKDDRQKSLSHALSDLDLTTIRLDLEPGEGEDSSLRIKLYGKSNYEKRPAPVNLNLNLNGQLQQLLNLGMDLSGM